MPLHSSSQAYMRSNKLFQKASSRQVANTGKGLEKPGPGELAAYEEDLQAHLEGLRKKLGSAPMNERREISLKSSGPGQVIGTKLKGLKKRAAELEKKPRSVIKGTLRSDLLSLMRSLLTASMYSAACNCQEEAQTAEGGPKSCA
ncbi:unnamed protein product [Symbiodinium necroappetens]|uniref:Uncharacterized protein n=1 Tax=Symbiodinium necroappetens TaxID=1628268 RepID=A0A812QPW8_9DINO|nr:unnamed protein product [Symbiodinium necroappetens]